MLLFQIETCHVLVVSVPVNLLLSDFFRNNWVNNDRVIVGDFFENVRYDALFSLVREILVHLLALPIQD